MTTQDVSNQSADAAHIGRSGNLPELKVHRKDGRVVILTGMEEPSDESRIAYPWEVLSADGVYVEEFVEETKVGTWPREPAEIKADLKMLGHGCPERASAARHPSPKEGMFDRYSRAALVKSEHEFSALLDHLKGTRNRIEHEIAHCRWCRLDDSKLRQAMRKNAVRVNRARQYLKEVQDRLKESVPTTVNA